MIKKSFHFICNRCENEYAIPFKESVQSVALARTVVLMKGWKDKGQDYDICPDCVEKEYRSAPYSLKKERNRTITILYIRGGASMQKIAKQYNIEPQRVHEVIHREINKKKTLLSMIPGFTECQESSLIKRCLKFKEQVVSILQRR